MNKIVMQKSIKKNFLYNIILKILNIIFPLVIFPYVARILSPEGIGKVDFSLSIIQYFILIAQVGIPMYAIRECAKVRDDKEELLKTVQEILTLNFVTIVASYVLFMITILSFEKLLPYRTLLVISSINILSTSIGVEWFYQAIEEYRYITLRSIFIKVLSLASIFIFIKNENDFVVYGFITVLSTALGYFYNFIHIRKHIDIFTKPKNLNIKKHIKPILMLFAMSISVSIYINLDQVMLGFLSGDSAVGLYTAANKMVKVILALVTSLGAVLLPRMSYYIENNELTQINRLIKKSLDFMLMISIPATIGIVILAKQIILLFAGPQYYEATTTIRIISPIIIVIGLSNLMGIQILVSYGKEKITLLSTIIGAIINFSINMQLIPTMQQNGAAIGTVIAETCVMVVQLIFSYSYIKGNINWGAVLSYLFGGLLIVLNTTLINQLISGTILSTVVSVSLSIPIYFGFLYIIKNEIVYEMSNKLFISLKK